MCVSGLMRSERESRGLQDQEFSTESAYKCRVTHGFVCYLSCPYTLIHLKAVNSREEPAIVKRCANNGRWRSAATRPSSFCFNGRVFIGVTSDPTQLGRVRSTLGPLVWTFSLNEDTQKDFDSSNRFLSI